jgi:hypothetical protein
VREAAARALGAFRLDPARSGVRNAPSVLVSLLWAALSLESACTGDDPYTNAADGSFGTGAPSFGSDAGIDGGGGAPDAGTGSLGPTLRVRFLHAIPNTGALLVCHDPDGPGPIAAQRLAEQAMVLRAEYGTRSATVSLPAVTTGALSLHRELRTDAGPAGFDAGVRSDGGAASDPCDEGTREVSIALPITDSPGDAGALALLPAIAGSEAITLLGTGVALDRGALDQRSGAEQALLQTAFGARVLIQRDPVPLAPQGFSLSVFHGVADVPSGNPQRLEREVGALRLCITAGTRDSGALPRPPATGIPFRVRTPVGDGFDARVTYDFRVFTQGDFDSQSKDCATTSAMPVARASFSKFQDGRAYTLALFGAIAPTALCSADEDSIARPTCQPSAAELGAKLVLLED